MIPTTLSVTKARAQLFDVVQQAQRGTPITLTQHGQTAAVVVSPELFESWMETLDIMTDEKLFTYLTEPSTRRRSASDVPLEKLKRHLLQAPSHVHRRSKKSSR